MKYTRLLFLYAALEPARFSESFGLSSGRDPSSKQHSARRQFITTTVATVMVGASPQVFAAVDDLSMPTPEEQAQKDKDENAERLRRKAELQKKMATPKTFNESLRNERGKQSEIGGLSKEERRERMCEELGRGC